VPEHSDKAPITALLQEWTRGDRKALDQLLPLIYSDLHEIARRRLQSLEPSCNPPPW
jgi:hypothetical protein